MQCVVNDQQCAGWFCEPCGQRNVREFERWVGRSFDKDETHRFNESSGESLLVRRVYEIRFHTKGCEHLPKESHRPAVDCLRDDDSITGAQQRQTECGGSCQPGGITSTELSAFKSANRRSSAETVGLPNRL